MEVDSQNADGAFAPGAVAWGDEIGGRNNPSEDKARGSMTARAGMCVLTMAAFRDFNCGWTWAG
jgi:hypothetical protein